jgi:hypothetical protein
VGTLTLEALAWASATARATALARQDGVWTKSGDPTRRYVGTISTTATAGQCEDSLVKRFVWNAQHRMPRLVRRFETATSWSYAVQNTYRQANVNAANQVAMVTGLLETPVQITVSVSGVHTGANGTIGVAIGEDSTTTPLAPSALPQQGGNATVRHAASATVVALPSTIGRHAYTWLEIMYTSGTATYYNDPAIQFRSGLVGTVWA